MACAQNSLCGEHHKGTSFRPCPLTGGVQTKGLESDSVAVAEARRSVMALLLHGDAAFAGQGVVAEMLQLANIPGEASDRRSSPRDGRGLPGTTRLRWLSVTQQPRPMPVSRFQEQ